MLLSEQIASSEKKYRVILEDFFNRISDVSFLPSHGIDHHRRVWHYAKEILMQLNDHGFEIGHLFTDKLIIACFLHDSGMVFDKGFRHGFEGKKICDRFLSENNLASDKFSEVLNAIEYHDNKDYTAINQPGDLLAILSVADDLDAFGFIGIYRYLEIYIARDMPLPELGDLIIENSEKRLNHFLRTYGFSKTLVDRHLKRFNILTSFFNSYNQHVPFYKFDNQMAAGYCGVAEIIMQMMKSNQSAEKISFQVKDYPDPVIQWFFGEMEHELPDFR